jgi:hypothetical protein
MDIPAVPLLVSGQTCTFLIVSLLRSMTPMFVVAFPLRLDKEEKKEQEEQALRYSAKVLHYYKPEERL